MATPQPREIAQSATRRHVPALDGVRGIAILSVLFYHLWKYRLFEGRDHSVVERILARGLPSGWIGVDLFFVLSGFLITGVLLDAKGSDGYFRSFYGRRAVRIMPLYFAAVGGLLLIAYIGGPRAPVELQALKDTQGWYWAHASNFLFLISGWNHATAHFWSLAMEEQFYLLWPLAVCVLSARHLLVTSLIMIGLSVGGRLVIFVSGLDPELSFFLLPLRLDALAAGACIAIVARDGAARAVLRRVVPTFLAATFIAFATYWVVLGLWQDGVAFTFGIPVAVALFAALVAHVVVRPESAVAKILEHPLLRPWGKYSYAMYVIHQPLIVLWDAPWRFARSTAIARTMPLVADLLCAAALSAVVFAAAAASWHLLEKHALELKRYFPYRPRSDRNDPKPAGMTLPVSAVSADIPR